MGELDRIAEVLLGAGDANRVISPVAVLQTLRVLGVSGLPDSSVAGVDLWRRWEGAPRATVGETPVVALATRVVHVPSVIPPSAAVQAQRAGDCEVVSAEITQNELDGWVREASAGLVDRSGISADPRVECVVQNVLTVAARWEVPFVPAFTVIGDFVKASGQKVPVPMMSREYALCAAVTTRFWRGVCLPYSDGRLVACVIESEAGEIGGVSGYAEAVEQLCGAQPRPINLRLPKFSVRSSCDLAELIDAPSDDVDTALHQAVLTVDEEGTVAGVLTEVAVAAMLREEVEQFFFNRPFMFVVADRVTSTPLLCAWVADPS